MGCVCDRILAILPNSLWLITAQTSKQIGKQEKDLFDRTKCVVIYVWCAPKRSIFAKQNGNRKRKPLVHWFSFSLPLSAIFECFLFGFLLSASEQKFFSTEPFAQLSIADHRVQETYLQLKLYVYKLLDPKVFNCVKAQQGGSLAKAKGRQLNA